MRTAIDWPTVWTLVAASLLSALILALLSKLGLTR